MVQRSQFDQRRGGMSGLSWSVFHALAIELGLVPSIYPDVKTLAAVRVS